MAQEEKNELQETTTILDLGGGDPFSTVHMAAQSSIEKEIKDINDENVETDIKPEIDVNDIEEDDQDEEEDIEEEEDIDTDDEEDDSDEDEDDDDEEDDSPNQYYGFAKSLQKQGFLDEELELDEDISPDEIRDLYKEQVELDVVQEIQANFVNQLKEQGITEENIIFARAIQAGVDVSILNDAAKMERYSKINIEESDDANKTSLIKAMYKDKGIDDEDAQGIIENAELDGDLDKIAAKAKKFYEKKFKDYAKNQDAAIDQARENQRILKAQTEQKLASMLKSKRIMNEKITAKQATEIKNAIYKADQIVEKDGQKYAATEFQKFLFEFNGSVEMQTLMFKKYKYRQQEKETIKKEAKKEYEDDFLSTYEKKTIKKRKKKKDTKGPKFKENTRIISFG